MQEEAKEKREEKVQLQGWFVIWCNPFTLRLIYIKSTPTPPMDPVKRFGFPAEPSETMGKPAFTQQKLPDLVPSTTVDAPKLATRPWRQRPSV